MPCATPTTVPLSLLPLRHLSPSHRHQQQHCVNPLRHYPCQSTTASSMPSTIPPPLNSMRLTMSTSAAMSTIPHPAVSSEVSFQPELQSQLTSLMSRLIQQATAAVASQIAQTTPNPLPATTLYAPSTHEIQLSAAVIPSQLVNTSDNLLPASTLDTPLLHEI